MKTQPIVEFSKDAKTVIVRDCVAAGDAQIEAEDFLELASDDAGTYELIDPQFVRKPNEVGEYVFPVEYFRSDEWKTPEFFTSKTNIAMQEKTTTTGTTADVNDIFRELDQQAAEVREAIAELDELIEKTEKEEAATAKAQLDADIEQLRKEREEREREEPEMRERYNQAIDYLKNKRPIALSRLEITALEAGLELLIDQAYETINAIEDDSMMDRKDKDEAIARQRDAVERNKALLERLTNHKLKIVE